jgi:hypothetical protein
MRAVREKSTVECSILDRNDLRLIVLAFVA